MLQAEGITPELHQQNALLRVDLASGKVLGAGVKDMDALDINFTLRKNIAGLPVPTTTLTHATAEAFGYSRARENSMLGYEYFKDAILKHVFRYFLNARDLEKLVIESNGLILRRFNQSYASQIGVTGNFLDLAGAYEKLYDHASSVTETKFFAEEARLESLSKPMTRRTLNFVLARYYHAKQRLERVMLRCSALLSGDTNP